MSLKVKKEINGEIRMISGCKDSQTSADVFNVSNFELPNPSGKAGGACTSALLKVLYNHSNNFSSSSSSPLTFQEVLLKMRDFLKAQNYTQIPQLTSSKALDIHHHPFEIAPPRSQKKRALIIGINYAGQQGELRGCHNDANNIMNFLMTYLDFQQYDIKVLMDDAVHDSPTKENIMKEMKELAEKSKSGDACFLHFSGHGGSTNDSNNDESDGKDETLIPIDFRKAGHITDDDIFQTLVLPLQKGVTLTCLMDCCHSGTVLDLPFQFRADSSKDQMIKITASNSPNLEASVIAKPLPNAFELKSIQAEIHMISGCDDPQYSMDIPNVTPYDLPDPAGASGGACTSALLKVLYSKTPDITFRSVLEQMREILIQQNLKQIPQLTSSRPLDVQKEFYIAPSTSNKRKAVVIGINYTGQQGQLNGCQNDANNIKNYLINVEGFLEEDIKMLLDDGICESPTRENILMAFDTLAEDCSEGDACFVHFSGHGGSVVDTNNDETNDSKDETLIPIDFRTAGHIVDDDLYSSFLCKLKKGVMLTCIIDACHSGTVLDLPYIYKAEESNRYSPIDSSVQKSQMMELSPKFHESNTSDFDAAVKQSLRYSVLNVEKDLEVEEEKKEQDRVVTATEYDYGNYDDIQGNCMSLKFICDDYLNFNNLFGSKNNNAGDDVKQKRVSI